VIVLDTHAWLWNVVAPRKLSPKARQAIARENELGV